jgi:hypothetical protein
MHMLTPLLLLLLLLQGKLLVTYVLTPRHAEK